MPEPSQTPKPTSTIKCRMEISTHNLQEVLRRIDDRKSQIPDAVFARNMEVAVGIRHDTSLENSTSEEKKG